MIPIGLAAGLARATVVGGTALHTALGRVGLHLHAETRKADAEAAHAIVRLAQARVPRRTGLLFDGIEAIETGGGWLVRAGAVNERSRWDTANYALFVEKGTQAGVRGGRRGGTVAVPEGGRSRAGTVNPVTGRRLRVANASRTSERTHPGTAAQPFFYPAVDAVLGQRAARHEAIGMSAEI